MKTNSRGRRQTLAQSILLATGLLTLLPATSSAELVAHWPLDTDASDATGNGHNGAVVGGTVNFGQPGANAFTGSAASFPDQGHIDVPYDAALNPGTQAVDGSGSFTVALWANSSDNANFNSPFTAREDNGVSVNGPIIYNNPTGVWSYWAGNNGPPGAWNAFDTTAVPLDTWQHVAITYDADTITRKMFIDGVEVLSQNIGVSANLLRDIHIGAGQDDGNNFFWNGLIDDVGLWDEALTQPEIQSVIDNGIGGGAADPKLNVTSTIVLPLDGTPQSFDIDVTNGGETQDLVIGGAEFSGANAANFNVDSVPVGAIGPGAAGTITISFDPLGDTGFFEATLEIMSNDSLAMQRDVSISGLIHDPQLVSDAVLDFGSLPSGSGAQSATLPLTNDGATQTLNISSVDVVGPQSANFSVTSFPATVDSLGGGNLEVSFDPAGGEGTFLAQLQINSDDPVSPAVIISMIARVDITNALVAWWPLDVDATDASGNGFDGAVVGAGVTFGQAGANAATAASTSFDGSGHIDVPWDPNLNGDGDFSVTLWANAAAAGGGSFRSPITNRDDVAPGGAFRHGFIIYNTNGGNWSFWNGGGTAGDGGWNTMDAGVVTIDQWLHLAITYDSALNEKKFYIDGVEAATSSPAAYSPNNSTLGDGFTHEDEDLHLGGGGDDGASFRWEGGIDDVGLFRSALTPSEIDDIMNNGIQGLVGGFLFQITELDQAKNGNVTLTFTSKPGVDYSIFRSIGTLGPFIELEDGVPGEKGTTQWEDVEGATLLNEPRVFYRVNETR